MIHSSNGHRRREWLRNARALVTSAALSALVTVEPSTAQTDESVSEVPRLAPERKVEGSRVISEADPEMEVRVPDEAAYLGARRLLINDSFDAEIHVFAEVDPFGLIERFYWIQFEHYLPGASGRYDYRQSNPEMVSIDGIEMHVRPGGENTTEISIPAGSDYEAFRRIVDASGYRLPTWLSTLRLVHLYEPSERGELMVVYGEGPDALAEAAAAAMAAGESGLIFADMLQDLIADVDTRVDLITRNPGDVTD